MTVFEKARAMGLDERQIALAQADFTPGMPVQHVMIHEAMDRVLICAKAYDEGRNCSIPHLGVGYVFGGEQDVIWRRRDSFDSTEQRT